MLVNYRPMLANHRPMLACYINKPNVGKQTSNIGSLYSLTQCWETILQCWCTIWVIPMLRFHPPKWGYYFQIPVLGNGPPSSECCLKIQMQRWEPSSNTRIQIIIWTKVEVSNNGTLQTFTIQNVV